MLFIRQILSIAIAFFAMLLCSNRSMASVIYFGEDINNTATGSSENAVRIAYPNSLAARNSFLANLQGVAIETFESYSANYSISSLSFGPDTAILAPNLTVLNIPSGTFNGVYPISGNKTLLQTIGNPNTFSIEFSQPQAAFGFYATDIEIPNNLKLRFLLADGITSIDRIVPTMAGFGGANNTGSVIFYGVIDTSNLFKEVSFLRTLNTGDGFGFDDMIIGRLENVSPIPEPSTLVIAATLFSVSLLRGRNRRRKS
jgi:hypothetical protein